MANFHILSGDSFANSFTVVYHIPIPDANNSAGVNWRTALVQYLAGDTPTNITSIVPSIGAELTQLQSGELLEVIEPFDSNPSQTLIQKRDAIAARFTALTTIKQTEYQNILSYWGYSYDLP